MSPAVDALSIQLNSPLGLAETKIPKPHSEDVPLADLPRSLPGPDATAELCESVQRDGMIEPVVIVRHKGKQYVVSGRRRIKAARQAEMVKVPARVYAFRDDDDPSTFIQFGVLLLNGQRHDNPIADLVAIETLLSKGASEAEIADATGLSILTVRSRLRLTALHGSLRDALRKGEITIPVAMRASKLPLPVQERLAKTYGETGILPMSALDEVCGARARQVAFEIVTALPRISVDLATWASVTADAINRLVDSGRAADAPKDVLDDLLEMARRARAVVRPAA